MGTPDRLLLDLAGFTGEDGGLGRPAAEVGWPVPATVEVDRGRLCWEGVGARVTTPRRLLDRFLGLADASDERIAEFARRWGVLFPLGVEPEGSVERYGLRPSEGLEPVGWWRRLAHDAGLVIDVAAKLTLSEPVPTEWWSRFRSLGVTEEALPAVDVLQFGVFADDVPVWDELGGCYEQSTFVQVFVNGWLDHRAPRCGITWSPIGGAALGIAPRGVLGALGLQLGQVLGRASGLAFCSVCGDVFAPSRKPRTGQRTYCDACRDPLTGREPQRQAERIYSAWRREMRRWNREHPGDTYDGVSAYRAAYEDGRVPGPL